MSLSLHLITAPTEEVVTLAEAKANLRQTSNQFDDLIQALIDSAVAQLDPASNGWLGRALRPQTWELRSDGFPYGYYGSGYDRNFRRNDFLELPYPPLISVVSVKYDDRNGAEQTLVQDTDFRVIGGGLRKSCIAPVFNSVWPSARCDVESVRVQFKCGYATASPDPLPQPIKQAVLLAVRDLWSLAERNLYLRSESTPGVATFEWTVSEMAGKVIRSAAENLLSTLRVYE